MKQVSPTPQALFRNLLLLQNTTKSGCRASPAEMMVGRKQRTTVQPCSIQTRVNWADHYQCRKKKQAAMAQQYNKTARASVIMEFQPGDMVFVYGVRGNRLPVQGMVLGKAETPRAYRIRLLSGHESIRSHRFLRLIPRSEDTSPLTPTRIGPQPASPPTTRPTEDPEEENTTAPDTRTGNTTRIPPAEDPPGRREGATRSGARDRSERSHAQPEAPFGTTSSGRILRPSAKALANLQQTGQLPSGFPREGVGSSRGLPRN